MSATPPGELRRAWPWLFAAAVGLGAYLRLDQFTAQVLIDDEWHAVHQMLLHGPGEMFRDFGYADYSIPLGILDWYEAHAFGLTELALRWPMMAAGLASLVLLPLYAAPRLGRASAAVFAFLLAISPLLVIYSRMARPYAITLLLGWVAHAAFHRYNARSYHFTTAGAGYAIAATLAIWLHPIAAPFVLAPLIWALAGLRTVPPSERRARLTRICAIGAVTVAATAVLVLPPLVAHPHSLAAKALSDHPDFGTAIGVWYAWLGTPSTPAVIVCVALAGIGARRVWRAPVARTGMLGIVLTLVLVLAAGPMYVRNPLTLARYLLPAIPLLLACVAAGTVAIARRVALPGTASARAAATLIGLLPCLALAVQSPLLPLLRHPNSHTLDLMYHFDFRPEANPFLPRTAMTPLSPFWESLITKPKESMRVAAAPFYFESYNWDAPRWERVSGQVVIPGFLTGLCIDNRFGELPQSPEFRFRNVVHLVSNADLAAKRIDYVVWQKPYVQTSSGAPEPIGADTAPCEQALRAKFGAPAFEDSHIIAFRLHRPGAGDSDAQR